jgi:hypothetical protein
MFSKLVEMSPFCEIQSAGLLVPPIENPRVDSSDPVEIPTRCQPSDVRQILNKAFRGIAFIYPIENTRTERIVHQLVTDVRQERSFDGATSGNKLILDTEQT